MMNRPLFLLASWLIDHLTWFPAEHSGASAAFDVSDGFAGNEGEEELIERQTGRQFRNRSSIGRNRQRHAVKRIVSGTWAQKWVD